MLVVVAYDVSDDRRRVRLHTALLAFGTPVQESVFECDLTETQKRAMRHKVARIVRRGTDRVRYYTLCQECAEKTVDADGTPRSDIPDVYVV